MKGALAAALFSVMLVPFAQAAAAPPPPPVAPSRIEVALSLGSLYRGVPGFGFFGAALGLDVGRRWDRLALLGHFSLGVQGYAAGLVAVPFDGTVRLEAIVSRFRIGGGGQVGGLPVVRVTSTSALFEAFVAANAHASVDVLQWGEHEPHTLLLFVDGTYGVTTSRWMYTAGAGAAIRF